MKWQKRAAAAIVAICVAVSCVGADLQAQGIQAQEAQGSQGEQETGARELDRQAQGGQELEAQALEAQGEEQESGAQEQVSEAQGSQEGQETGARELDRQAQGGQELEAQAQEGPKAGVLNFIMQESDQIQAPGVQRIVVSLDAEGSALEAASLQYRNMASGREFSAEAQAIAGNMASFEISYESESQAGVYELQGVSYQKGGEAYQVRLQDLDMQVSYGVNMQAPSEPDELLVDEALPEVEANVVTVDENGNAVSENTLEDVLGNGRAAVPSTIADPFTRGAKNLVVVLDPGHDNTHTGAAYNGCREQDLVLSIALYCREQLQRYDGVTVYMTREAQACANGGGSVDAGTCNARRVEFAAGKGADVFVSFHLNASPSSGARGVGVYYPNSNYRSDIGAEAGGLATAVCQKLAALGLPLWAGGKLIRNSEDHTTYPDGSLADYLAVIRRSKLAGFPAILIEHAFVSNIQDVTGFLNSSEKLRNLGYADANGIAEYYGLHMKGDTPTITGAQSRGSKKLRIGWDAVKDAVSYELCRSASEDGEYAKIADVKGCTYDDAGLEEGKAYYYKARAVYSDGKKSEYSNAYKGQTLAKPQISSVLSKAGGKLKISWKAVDNASKYVLYRSQTNSNFKKIAEFSAQDAKSYIDGKIDTQTVYFYKLRVRGGDGNGYSAYSKAVSGWAIKGTKISQISSNTYTSLKIKWKKVEGAYGYRIRRSLLEKGPYQTVATVKGANSYIDEGLEVGQAYYYKVQAMNRTSEKNGCSSYSKPASGSTLKRTYLLYVRSKKSGSMEIKWKKRANAYAYRIKRSTEKNGKYTQLAELKGADTVTYTDTTATAGKKFFYAVELVVDKKGVKQYSGNSRAVSAVNLAKVQITSMQVQGKGVKISWAKAAGANGYQVVRSTELNGTYAKIADLEGADTTSYTDTGVYAGERYYYKVRAIRDGKYVGYGSYPKGVEKWALGAPQDVKAERNEDGQVRLSWKQVDGAAGYEILRSATENGSYEVVASLSGAGSSAYTDTASGLDTSYYYKVAATGKVGNVSGRGEESAVVFEEAATEGGE